MAKRCTHCGQELAKDDAQFCTRCGMLVAQPASEKGHAENPPPPAESIREKSGLREQIAQQPGTKPVSLPAHPAWMNTLGRDRSPSSLAGHMPLPSLLKEQSGFEPEAPGAHDLRSQSQPGLVADQGADRVRETAEDSPLAETISPVTPPLPAPLSPARELRIKIWEPDGSEAPLPSQPTALPLQQGQPAPSLSAFRPGEPATDIEDIPTGNLPFADQDPSAHLEQKDPSLLSTPENAAIEEIPTRSLPLTPAQRDVLGDHPVVPSPAKHIDEVADADTALIPSASPVNKAVSLPGIQGSIPSPVSLPGLQSTTPPASLPGLPSGLQSAPPPVLLPSPQAQISKSPAVPSKKSGRSLLFSLLALFALFLLGGGIWISVAHPFSISPVTQPWQEFHGSDLGFALRYPTGWSSSSPAKGSVSLHDSSNTAQLTISTAAANGTDATHALQQQVNKLNVTNVKVLDPLSFAGVQWQRQQGSTQINGATYTITLLAVTHGTSLYTLEQIAAQNVYPQYEQTIFAPMRASARFL